MGAGAARGYGGARNSLSPPRSRLAGLPWLQDAQANYRENEISSSNIPASARLPTRREIQRQFNKGPGSKQPAAAVGGERNADCGALSAPHSPCSPPGCAVPRPPSTTMEPQSERSPEPVARRHCTHATPGLSPQPLPAAGALTALPAWPPASERGPFPSLLREAPGTRGHSMWLLQTQRLVRRRGAEDGKVWPQPLQLVLYSTVPPKQKTHTCRS